MTRDMLRREDSFKIIITYMIQKTILVLIKYWKKEIVIKMDLWKSIKNIYLYDLLLEVLFPWENLKLLQKKRKNLKLMENQESL